MQRRRTAARTLGPFAAAAAAGLLLAGLVGNARGDDRDLLRTTGAVPYVFFMLDTSSSMNADFDGTPLVMNGDDPRSKIYIAKKQLYEVFLGSTEFHYGFAFYNQDTTRVTAKHWLYAPATPGASVKWTDSATGVEFAWPERVDLPPRVDEEGEPAEDPSQTESRSLAASDAWVFGPLFAGLTSDPAAGEPGGCDDPFDLSDPAARRAADRFPRVFGEDTGIWIVAGGQLYKVSMSEPVLTDGLTTAAGGEPVIRTTLTLEKRVPGQSCQTLSTVAEQTVDLELASSFLFHEDPDQVDGKVTGGLGREEVFGGSWQQLDAFSGFDCGGQQPFGGKGWEGNYDSDDYVVAGTDPPQPASAPTGVDLADVDEFCADGQCVNLHYVPTELRSEGRNVDFGDLVPFDWADNHHAEFLTRLNPRHNAGGTEFRAAPFFADAPQSGESFLRPKLSSQKPLVAAGASPLAKAINDFRCWYSEKRSGQCRNVRYPLSWERVAREAIGNEAGCVQPYLIIVTDAENTCGGESPVADVAAMRSQANVRTWVIAMAPEGSASGEINAIPRVGRGELIYAENEDELRTTLEQIRGIIDEEARTFASAAVPTVQATVLDKIFVSNFIPLNSASVWPGTVNAFLKPLPLTDDGRPNTGHERHLWSAGEVLVTQANDADPLGPAATQRRVYYTPLFDSGGRVMPGELGTVRRFLESPDADSEEEVTAEERDLWRGLGLAFTEGSPSSEATAREDAARILADTYAVKTADVEDIGPVTYLLGDIFHSDPTIVGGPANVRFFAGNVPGYRDFARRHENRRKVLLVGTNDGMLHGFDAGQAEIVDRVVEDDGDVLEPGDVRFTNGTGKELFAYVPRPMLNEIRERADVPDAHDWGLDGSVKVVDVFVDPVYDLAPDPDDREWRTIVVGGYRRGAPGYYALDVTQPDSLREEDVGVPARTVFVPEEDTGTIPSCHDGSGGSSDPLTCHEELAWPAPLWEFQDTRWNGSEYVALDEDLVDTDDDGVLELVGNGRPDLANSWSVPNLGRIRICEGDDCIPSTDPAAPDDLVDKYVAVFGGGLPAGFGDWGVRGNFLYIVDMETGETIYKRQLEGSVPSEPAAVDTDNDGYLDRIYVGTTARSLVSLGPAEKGGFMYRVDLVEFEVDEDGNRTLRPFPNLVPVTIRDVNGATAQALRIPRAETLEGGEEGLPIWEPKKIFDTLAPVSDTNTTEVRRPIFFRPSVLFVAELGKYALSFGTGDREDLWRPTDVEGRIYTFVDDSDDLSLAPGDLPFDETLLRRVDLLDANIDVTDPDVVERNFLLDRSNPGTRGWVMTLDPKERLINEPFALSGVSFFVSYTPRIETVRGECTREGDSRLFAVNTTNANGFLRDVDKNRVRFIERKAFATSPFTELAQTKNPTVDADEDTGDDLELGTHLDEVMEELKTLFPENCKFGNYRIDVKTVLSDTGVVFIAPVPVCIVEKNWKEFDR